MASLSQQVVVLLAGGEESIPQTDHATSDPSMAKGILHQGPTNGSVHLVTPWREGGARQGVRRWKEYLVVNRNKLVYVEAQTTHLQTI